MKKLIIGALVGSILLFAWPTLSWTILNLHASEFQQAKDEAGVMNYLNSQFSEDGQYMIPTASPDATSEEMEKLQADMKGKPWTVISYHKSYDVNMMTNIIRGFLAILVAAFFVCWILMKQTNSSFMGTFLSCVFIGVAGLVSNRSGRCQRMRLLDLVLIRWMRCLQWRSLR